MKTLAASGALALTLALASCAEPPRALESPPPPAPPPAESRAPARESQNSTPAPPAEAIPPQKVERPPGLLSKPSFSVTMVEKTGEKRTAAAEQAVKAANLLVMNGYEAHTAKPPEDLPASRIEAAQKAAGAAAREPRTGQLFIFGEITRGATTDVRVTAIEPRDGKIIDDQGFRSSKDPVEKIVERAISALLPTIESYWRIRK